MSLGPIYRKTVQLAVEHAGKIERFLDIGAGRGEMVHMLREKTRGESFVCDYTDKLLQVPDQKVDIADLNTDPLPYPDNHFDLVTATEVIEHLENHRAVMRDIFRVLKPGGLCVLSTPNILNIGSRLRFLWFGFWNLFGPLPVRNSDLYTTGGHINPIGYFYIAHSLTDAGFEKVEPHIDKRKRSGVAQLLFWSLPIKFFAALSWRREVKRFHTIDKENAPFVRAMNSRDLLLGRTVIVAAVKPAAK